MLNSADLYGVGPTAVNDPSTRPQDSCGNALTFGGGPTVASMHMGNRAGFDTLIFLAGLAALPWGPIVHAVPPNWGWCDGGSTPFGTTHPYPSTREGCGQPFCDLADAPMSASAC